MKLVRADAILFDLDGTLLDTLGGLARSANAMLEELGAPIHPTDAYRSMVGAGIRHLVEAALPTARRDAATVDEAVVTMRRHYKTLWREHSPPFPGILELLARLAERDLPLAILSNKPHDYTVDMVAALLPALFVQVVGARPDVPHKPDPTSARALAAELHAEPAHCLFVGDSDIDMQTAVNAGMQPIGVSWGLRSVEELRRNGALRILSSPAELLALLT